MADDDFPIMTAELVPFAPGVGVGVIDLSVLADALSPRVTDPFVETADGATTRPATAATTAGPHRYTVFVPNTDEYSVINVGAGDPGANRINDMGLTGKSKTHIHFHTTAAPQTMVLLGGPTANHGWAGPNGANNPAASSGYMVVTEGKAWQESRGHQYLMSKEADATLRAAAAGKRVVLQADAGAVDIHAMHNIYAGAPTISIMAPGAFIPAVAVNYDGTWTSQLSETTAGKWQKTVTTIAGIVTGGFDLYRKAPKVWKSWKKGKKELETSVTDSAKWALDAVKWGLTVNKQLKLFSTDPGPGQLKLGADSDVGVLAGGDVGIWGGSGFSAGGGIWTSISGGLSTSIKAVGWAGVGGTWTSIKAYRKLDLTAELGKLTAKGKTLVDITCEEGDTKVGGANTAQVVAGKNAHLFGGETVYVGTGPSDGFGFKGEASGAWIGRITGGATDLENPTRNTNFIEFKKAGDKMSFVSGEEFHNCSGKIELKSKGYSLDAGGLNVEVQGSKILLG